MVWCRRSRLHILSSGLPTERLLAYIAVSKYADGLPLYRQEAIYLRDGVEISRSLMAQWMGHLGFELQICADYILERVKEGERVFADETTLPTLAPGSGKATKAWLWAYARDDRPYGGSSPPMVAYRFEDSRGAECVARHLAGFNGILQVDGYGAYTSMIKAQAKAGRNEQIQLAGCWAHLRRKFYDLHVSGISQAATDTVIAMTKLWKIEDEVRGKNADIRAAFRQEQSETIVARLFDLWEKELGKVSGKSKPPRRSATRSPGARPWSASSPMAASKSIAILSSVRSDHRQSRGKTACLPEAKAVDGPGLHWPRFSRHAK